MRKKRKLLVSEKSLRELRRDAVVCTIFGLILLAVSVGYLALILSAIDGNHGFLIFILTLFSPCAIATAIFALVLFWTLLRSIRQLKKKVKAEKKEQK